MGILSVLFWQGRAAFRAGGPTPARPSRGPTLPICQYPILLTGARRWQIAICRELCYGYIGCLGLVARRSGGGQPTRLLSASRLVPPTEHNGERTTTNENPAKVTAKSPYGSPAHAPRANRSALYPAPVGSPRSGTGAGRGGRANERRWVRHHARSSCC